MAEAALVAHELVRGFGGRRVLDGVSLTAAPGRRLGLIGENGAGKSTLLRLLAGTDQPDGGTVTRPPDLGFLHQEMTFPDAATVGDVVDDALAEARAVLADLDRLAGDLTDEARLAEYAERLELAQRLDAWDAGRRAGLVLDGLGLGGVTRDRALGTLSGGQRRRLALAALVVRRPSALLLDEPTNHLDDDAATFLEEQLRGQPGAVVVASHDRAFLDAVCTDLLDLDPAVDGPVRFGGTYSEYLRQKRADRARWERRYAEEQEELAGLRDSLGLLEDRVTPKREMRDNNKMAYGMRGDRVEGQISRRIRNATRRLEELDRRSVPAPPRPLSFTPPALTSPADELVSLRQVHVPDRLTLDSFDVRDGDRVLVTGLNGSGKSTLLLVLAGRLEVPGVRRQPGLRVGLLDQDTSFANPRRTARATYGRALGADRVAEVPLESLGLLHRWDLGKPVGALSVGQRRRLALALLVADPPQLLLLDEPTNHLSPALCDELEDALGPGPGAVVLASHDRWLRGRWTAAEVALSKSGGQVRRTGDT
ncbi:macrolide transport system ATP-binding/permease protein [Lentzea fradiae]|uniref:Macrolide transport system ATP-binding/permease protein n=1 Tax=Lentzea fradiae TaxID=200378 RepID=A0A1G7VC01_9PSEU|nr:ABC-F family ATP-binding cassette domain-containing protein [Lentzea fradiae]SDG56490.1 macrolide transport system ATP-binding/permease protein [Lentzea fradiae]